MTNQKELDYEEETKRIQEDRKRAVHDGFDFRLDLQSNENSNPLMRKRDENSNREREILDEKLREIIDGKTKRVQSVLCMIPFKCYEMRQEPNMVSIIHIYIYNDQLVQ